MTNLEGFTHVDAEFTIFYEDSLYIDYELIARLVDGSELRAMFFYDRETNTFSDLEYHESPDLNTEWQETDEIPQAFKNYTKRARLKAMKGV